MIFVYPAVVSDDIDPHKLKAFTKSLEIYYLNQIAESIGTGVLRIRSHYNGVFKKRYGPLIVENLSYMQDLYDNEPLMLMETKDESIVDKVRQYDTLKIDLANFQKELDGYKRDLLRYQGTSNPGASDQIKIIELENDIDRVEAKIEEISNNMSDLEKEIDVVQSKEKREQEKHKRQKETEIEDDRRKEEDDERRRKSDDRADEDDTRKNKDDTRKDKDDVRKKTEDKIKKRKDKVEKKTEKRDERDKTKSKGGSGTYQPAPLSDMSYAPTQMILNDVEVTKIGGPHKNELEKQSVTVGVKIVPFRVKDYDNFMNVLMSDYYSNFMMRLFKASWRMVARATLRVAKRLVKRVPGLLGGNYLRAMFDPSDPTLLRGILLNQKGLVDASTFSAKKGRAQFYQFSAAIVMMSLEDIFDQDRENFLQRPKQIRGLFKLGWNSFFIADESKQMSYFISLTDGGAVYTLPYSYMFTNLKLDKVYDGMDPLKKQARPFLMKRGNYKALGRVLTKESAVTDIVNKKLLHYSEDL